MSNHLHIVLLAVFAAGCASALYADSQVPVHDPDATPAPALEADHGVPAEQNASTASGQIGPDAMLEDLLAYADENNPGLRAAHYRWRARVERIPQARSLPDPMLNYGYFAPRSADRQAMMARQVVSVMQMFPAFGKRGLRAEMAGQGAEVERQRLEAVRLAVFTRVKAAYAEYAYVDEGVRVMRETRDLLRQFEEVALARFRADEVGSPDVLRVQMELDRVEDQLASMKAMRVPAAAALNAAIGRPDGSVLPAPRLERLPVLDEAAERDLDGWLAANPNLRALDREIARAETGVELARRESWPDFTVGFQAIERRGESTEGMVMVGVNLPIWRDNYAAARNEARAERKAAFENRQSLQRDLESDLRMALFRVRDAERKTRLFGDLLLPKASASFESLQAAYRVGDTDFIDVIDAQRELLEVQLGHQRAIADHMQRIAEFERIIGGVTSPGGEAISANH